MFPGCRNSSLPCAVLPNHLLPAPFLRTYKNKKNFWLLRIKGFFLLQIPLDPEGLPPSDSTQGKVTFGTLNHRDNVFLATSSTSEGSEMGKEQGLEHPTVDGVGYQHLDPECSGIPCTQDDLHQCTVVIKCSSMALDPTGSQEAQSCPIPVLPQPTGRTGSLGFARN